MSAARGASQVRIHGLEPKRGASGLAAADRIVSRSVRNYGAFGIKGPPHVSDSLRGRPNPGQQLPERRSYGGLGKVVKGQNTRWRASATAMVHTHFPSPHTAFPETRRMLSHHPPRGPTTSFGHTFPGESNSFLTRDSDALRRTGARRRLAAPPSALPATERRPINVGASGRLPPRLRGGWRRSPR